MEPIESFEDILERDPPRPIGQELEDTVVWLTGEHDASTVSTLSATLAEAIALDDTDLVVDLSGVGFMDVSTLRVILRARAFLIRRGHSLMLRSPTSCALLVLNSSGLMALVQPERAGSAHATPATSALASWVEVPVTDLAPPRAAPAPTPSVAEGA